MEPSERLWNYLKEKEGFRQFPYSDQEGNPTIGYGHLIQPGEKFTKVNTAEAESILKKDAFIAVDYINNIIVAPLNQNQFDALVSLVYNIGTTAFSHSTIKMLLNWRGMDDKIKFPRQYQRVAAEFHRWNKIIDPKTKKKRVSNGLVRRRLEESERFLEPINGPAINVQELTPEKAARIKRDAEYGAGESML